jgi:hypothetical protein
LFFETGQLGLIPSFQRSAGHGSEASLDTRRASGSAAIPHAASCAITDWKPTLNLSPYRKSHADSPKRSHKRLTEQRPDVKSLALPPPATTLDRIWDGNDAHQVLYTNSIGVLQNVKPVNRDC